MPKSPQTPSGGLPLRSYCLRLHVCAKAQSCNRRQKLPFCPRGRLGKPRLPCPRAHRKRWANVLQAAHAFGAQAHSPRGEIVVLSLLNIVDTNILSTWSPRLRSSLSPRAPRKRWANVLQAAHAFGAQARRPRGEIVVLSLLISVLGMSFFGKSQDAFSLGARNHLGISQKWKCASYFVYTFPPSLVCPLLCEIYITWLVPRQLIYISHKKGNARPTTQQPQKRNVWCTSAPHIGALRAPYPFIHINIYNNSTNYQHLEQ